MSHYVFYPTQYLFGTHRSQLCPVQPAKQEQRPSLHEPRPEHSTRCWLPLRPTRFSGSCAGRDGPTACAAVSFHASFGSVFRIQGATPVWKSASELGFFHAIESTRSRRQRRVDGLETPRHRADAATKNHIDGVGRPKFDFHTGRSQSGTASWSSPRRSIPRVGTRPARTRRATTSRRRSPSSCSSPTRPCALVPCGRRRTTTCPRTKVALPSLSLNGASAGTGHDPSTFHRPRMY